MKDWNDAHKAGVNALDTADKAWTQPNGNGDAPSNAPKLILPTPFVWRDPSLIPPRRFIYGRHYARGFIGCTFATGGKGKTSLLIGEALAMASGQPLLGVTPKERARVWIWNGEDPIDELERRVAAAMIEHKLAPQDIAGYLFLDVGRQLPIVLATQGARNSVQVAEPIVDALMESIRRNRIDVLMCDPFVKCHRVSENDNTAVDAVATQWAKVADVADCVVELAHHTRKTGSAEITVEDGRGAGSLLNASRSARVLNSMTKDEAAEAGIEPASAWRHFRVDDGKASMTPPAECAEWYRLASVDLGNGDNVGVATAWSWPDPFESITVHDLRAAQKAVSEGGPWRADIRAKLWVGKPIAKALKLNAQKKPDRAKIRQLLSAWTANGMFVVIEGRDEHRRETEFVEVGTWASD